MRQTFVMIFFLLSCNFMELAAGEVKQDKARLAAQNWYRHYAPDNKKSASIVRFSEYKHNGRSAFYIFNFDQGCFVLVSAHNALPLLISWYWSEMFEIMSLIQYNNE